MFKAEHENPNSTWSVWVKVIFQEQKGCGQWERLWGSLHWSKWHSYGISATWKPCGAADQAPAQGKVRRAQVDMRSGEVGSGVTPVLHSDIWGIYSKLCNELRYDFARKGDTPEFSLNWERTRQPYKFVQSNTSYAAVCLYPECTDAPKAMPGFSEGSSELDGNLNTDLSRTGRPLVQKSTAVRSKPSSCNVLSTAVAISNF